MTTIYTAWVRRSFTMEECCERGIYFGYTSWQKHDSGNDPTALRLRTASSFQHEKYSRVVLPSHLTPYAMDTRAIEGE